MKAFSVLAVAFVLVMGLSIYEAWAADAGADAGAGAVAPATQPAAAPTKPAAPATPAAPAAEPEDAVTLFKMVVTLFKDGAYRPAIGALITLLMFFWRRFLSGLLIGKIPTKHLGWFTAALGVLAAIPAALSTSPFDIWKFLLDALLISGPAVLFWTTLGKTVLPKLFGELPAKTE